MDNYIASLEVKVKVLGYIILKFPPPRMDNYLGRVVGEVAHAGKHNPEIDLLDKFCIFLPF